MVPTGKLLDLKIQSRNLTHISHVKFSHILRQQYASNECKQKAYNILREKTTALHHCIDWFILNAPAREAKHVEEERYQPGNNDKG